MIPLRIWWLSLAAAATFSFVSLPPGSAQTPPVAATPNDPFGKEVSLVAAQPHLRPGGEIDGAEFSSLASSYGRT